MITNEDKKYAVKVLLGFGRKNGSDGFKAVCVCVLALGVDPELVYEAIKEIGVPCNHDEQVNRILSELEGMEVFERILKRMHETTMKN